ncbi:unnamed protein product (macronuclear) [Paramecium tetraurelia]|uniref:Uncharacterized protein n=1 Tax=Paramecium tetraurelia TaxID=5888 RepID=A0CL15_PARTE|nr:uncharacterized protein GSPATT00008029001 [Paramecium tetraurelia]CAK71482.1 unnamed protein product [Paramecium tetraurelia]|eukprot:XP_001438879.1 hypothetical protein (macronuclear) [Paramecium tetraurelia strain d4-2]
MQVMLNLNLNEDHQVSIDNLLMQTFCRSQIQSQIRSSSLTTRRQNFKSFSLSQYTSEDEISRQIRFDPLIQQLDFMLKKRTPKNKNIQTLESKFYNPFEFKIKNYQMINVRIIPNNEKGKRKAVTSYRKQLTSFKGREKSQQTQWQRVSQEFSDTYM